MMDGTAIVRALLLARPALVAFVGTVDGKTAQERIRAGDLPAGTALPAIGLAEISSTDRRTLGGVPTSKVKVTCRVQVTAFAATYTDMKTLLGHARAACRDFVGIAAGVAGVTSALEGKGPDFTTDAGWYAQTQDVMVTFDEVAL